MAESELREGYVPGAIGRITELHGVYYHDEWGFDLFFEAKMATELTDFLESYDPERDGFWTAIVGGRIEGSIAIDGRGAEAEGAELRWFITSDALRGSGAGRALLGRAMAFCRERGYPRVSLWTFEGLDAAKHLYTAAGFELAEERVGTKWGTEVAEQRLEWKPSHP
jgi:GNAT superfamily N-acetyltransferase